MQHPATDTASLWRQPPASATLRAAVQEANAHSDPDTIALPPGLYRLSVPGANEDAAATGDLDLTNSVTINGAGARTTRIDANGIDRVFEVFSGVTASIRGVTITRGKRRQRRRRRDRGRGER